MSSIFYEHTQPDAPPPSYSSATNTVPTPCQNSLLSSEMDYSLTQLESNSSKRSTRIIYTIFSIALLALIITLRYQVKTLEDANVFEKKFVELINTKPIFNKTVIITGIFVATILVEVTKLLISMDNNLSARRSQGLYNIWVFFIGIMSISLILDMTKLVTIALLTSHNIEMTNNCPNSTATFCTFGTKFPTVVTFQFLAEPPTYLNYTTISTEVPITEYLKEDLNLIARLQYCQYMTYVKNILVSIAPSYTLGMPVYMMSYVILYITAQRKWEHFWITINIIVCLFCPFLLLLIFDCLLLQENIISLLFTSVISLGTSVLTTSSLRRICLCERECWKIKNDLFLMCDLN